MHLWKRLSTGLPTRGHCFIASELDSAHEELEQLNNLSSDYEQKYADLAFEYRLGLILLFLSSQTLIYSLYLSVVGHNFWGVAYICIFYVTNMILFGLYDVGWVHDLSPIFYHCLQFLNNTVSGALTASTFLWLGGLRGSLYAQLGALLLSVFLNIINYDASFRNFIILNLTGLAFSYTTLIQHLRPTGLITIICSFALSIVICPLLSQCETKPSIRRYYWLLHSVNNAFEILASSLLLVSVSY